MNEKLPKPMFDALAREAKPADHPSADVLSAFIEQALADREKQSVAAHLASCAQCRDVVFLASSAAEETGGEQQLVAAAHATSRWTWRRNLIWAAPLAAVLLLAGGYFAWHGTGKIATGPELASKRAAEAPVRQPELSQKLAVEQPSPGVAAPLSVAKPRVTAPPAKTPPAREAQPVSADVVATNGAPAAPAENKEQGSTVEMAKAAPQAPAITIGGAMGGMAPAPKANGFAPSAGESEAPRQFGTADSLSVSVNRAVAGVARTAHPGWRITPQGHLEHLTSEGWTKAFPEQRRVFRVVAVIAGQVWAGGDGGALFHSSDGGQHWNKASLATGEGAETAAIVSIRFEDPQHGVIATDSGSSYGTTDGGVTWTKQ
jgi:Putative zinc-finger